VTFTEPGALWLLTVVVTAIGVPLASASRRRRVEEQLASPAMRSFVVARQPGIRRGIVAVGVALFLVLVVLASARPARSVEVQHGVATVVVALDTSRSMGAEDVVPTRMAAARRAARRFVQAIPPRIDVAYVEFANSAVIQVPATDDRGRVLDAIRESRRSPGTAIGEGIFKSLSAIARSAGVRVLDDQPLSDLPPAAIVLLSDGTRNAGRSELGAADVAGDAGIPVSTIAFGTPEGEYAGRLEPADERALTLVAERTGGRAFRAGNADQLDFVYRGLATGFTSLEEERDLTGWFVGAALLVGAVTALLSIVWFARAP
jgi:Ca-activated chloride channel family protein